MHLDQMFMMARKPSKQVSYPLSCHKCPHFVSVTIPDNSLCCLFMCSACLPVWTGTPRALGVRSCTPQECPCRSPYCAAAPQVTLEPGHGSKAHAPREPHARGFLGRASASKRTQGSQRAAVCPKSGQAPGPLSH